MIRPATLNDINALLELENSVFSGDHFNRRVFRYLLQKANALTLVDVENSSLKGYCTLLFRKGSTVARLYSIAVNTTHHGQGTGKELLKTAELAATKHACDAIVLEVREDNARAIYFYEKAGYSSFGWYENFYEDHSKALRLRKKLQ